MVRTLFLLLALALCIPAPARAASEQEENLSDIFAPMEERPATAGQATFLFWVQGDADHFVPETSTGAGDKKLKRADAVEVGRIESLARKCGNCNVVLLHIQRGGARWYTRNKPFATYLRVFSQGRELLERHVPMLNAADPQVIAGLVAFGRQAFPDTTQHFVYRGHSFVPTYEPGKNDKVIAPFAYGFRGNRYGIDEFAHGMALANLGGKAKLATITIAACRMAYLEVAAALAPYTQFVITSQVDILETLAVSFDFQFLTDPSLSAGEEETATLIARSLMKRFNETPHLSEAMMETPVTVIRATGIAHDHERMQNLIARVKAEDPAFFERERRKIEAAARVEKLISARYVKDLAAKGKSAASIGVFIKSVKLPSPDKDELDAIRFLEAVASYSQLSGDLRQELGGLALSLSSRVELFESPAHSTKSGLSFRIPL